MRYRLRTLLIVLALGWMLAMGMAVGYFGLAAFGLRERLAYSYDGFAFYETTYNSCTDGLAGIQGLEKIFVSIDGGPGKRLSEVTWDDFGPSEKLIIEGDANKGTITCNGTMVSFRDGKPGLTRLGESPRIRFGAAANGPFLSLPATPKQIRDVFGKPKKTRPTV